jgi:hypothetical protein
MKRKLQGYLNDLRETTAARERIESELKIAHDIQMSMVPKTFPPFPDRPEFDIYATLVPAREVAGTSMIFPHRRPTALFRHRGCVRQGDSRVTLHGADEDHVQASGDRLMPPPRVSCLPLTETSTATTIPACL